jgi:hypothetical protein
MRRIRPEATIRMARRDLCDAGPVIVGSSIDGAADSRRQTVAQEGDGELASLAAAGTVRVLPRTDGARPARKKAIGAVHEGMEPRFRTAPLRITHHAVASNPP